MYEVKWLRAALADLDHIADFIARDNPDRAQSFVHEIFNQVEALRRFPFMGPSSEDIDARELVVHRNYLVVYRLVGETVEILQIWLPKIAERANEGAAKPVCRLTALGLFGRVNRRSPDRQRSRSRRILAELEEIP